MDVLCLGISVADIVVKPVEKLPPRGKLLLVDKVELHTGGGAANVGNDLGKLGVDTGVITKVGSDGFGDFVESVLKENNVDVRGLRRDPEVLTSATIAVVAPDGERSFFHYLGANAKLCEDDIDFDLIKEAKVLYIGYAFLMSKLDGAPTVKLIKRAREMGVKVCLDTVWDAQGRWLKLLEPYFEYVNVFLTSFDEAREISRKETREDIVDFFLSYGIEVVGLKMGSSGSYAKSRHEEVKTPPFKVDVVETTGAGDAFVAGFLTGLVKGWSLERTCKFANAVGACCVQAIGASTGVRSIEETLKFMEGAEVVKVG